MSTDDAELLRSWRAGDARAGEALFERYFSMVERFFLNKVAVSIDDLVQETFVACVESRDRIKDQGKFRSYLFSVAYNVLNSHLRRTYRQGRVIDLEDQSIADLAPSAGSLIVNRDEQRLLLEGLRNIPIRDQLILELHYWEGMTTAQIGEVLAVPASTARTQLWRARDKLEAAMTRLGDSGEVLESTLMHLDDWARQIREQLRSGG